MLPVCYLPNEPAKEINYSVLYFDVSDKILITIYCTVHAQTNVFNIPHERESRNA